jgi:hypothetical protein
MHTAPALPTTPSVPFTPLLTPSLDGWQMAGAGGFRWLSPDIVESHGGPGIFWYGEAVYADFMLRIEWQLRAITDSSGVFLRIPALRDDPAPAIAGGYEVQIDDRGLDPRTGRTGSPRHLTGALYEVAGAQLRASLRVGSWNLFEITAQGPAIEVVLNGTPVCRIEQGERRRSGHIGLQAHHEGSTVRFRRLEIARL